MRKLNGMAKRSIGMFAAVTVLSAGIVVGSVVKVIASQEESYPIAAGDFVFDNTASCLEAERDGYIRRSWNSEYELESGDSRFVLGKKTVGYSPGDNQVRVYGGGYLLKEDGMVTTLGRLYGTDNMQETRFIKMDDDRFVICGENIVSDDGNMETEKFLYVVLDKAGNARLMNHLINVKVLGDTALSTGNLKLNLADKTLDFAGNLLALDDVTGNIGEGGEVYDLFIRGGSGGRGGKGGIGGTGGIGGAGGKGGLGGIGAIGGNGNVTTEMIEMLTDMYIRRADETTNSLTCRFNIYDPFNYMGASQFFLWKTADNIVIDNITQSDLNSGKVVSMAANAGDTELTFGNLKPNTDYTMVMGFINNDGTFTERDRLTARTRKYDASIRISEFREDSFKYVVKLDPGMEDIQKVTVKCGDKELYSQTVSSDNKLPSQIETMMTDDGYEGIRQFTGTEADDLKENSAYEILRLSVEVTFKNNAYDAVTAKLDVVNPFYGQESSVSAISELQEAVAALRDQQEALKSQQLKTQTNTGGTTGTKTEASGDKTDNDKESKPSEGTSDDDKESKPSEGMPDDDKEGKPSEGTSDDDKESKPSEGTSDDGKGSKPSEGTSDDD